MQEPENQRYAYSRAYQMLGTIYLRGPIPTVLPQIQAVPELAAALPDTGPDELAADHYQIFSLEIHPFESAFLGTERALGGQVTESVLAEYVQAGYPPQRFSEAADHIGLELLFLSYLCEQEARAEESGDTFGTTSLREGQYRFLGEHLLRWLPMLYQAVRNYEEPFYTSLAEFTLALASSHYDELASVAVDTQRRFVLREPPDLLSDETARLRDIAGYILTPAYTGVYFSRRDVQQLAREQSIPRGFGDREQMLTNLLRNTAEYDQLQALFSRVRTYVKKWGSELEELASNPLWGSAIVRFTRPWIERTAQADAVLREIERLVEDSQ